jgi:hypothetical protein
VFGVKLYNNGHERIKIKTYRDFVSVWVEKGKGIHFGDSVGLMGGDFSMGQMLARDGKTVIDDPNAFGQEWQVLDQEPTLFQTVHLPQHPQVCTLPTPKQTSVIRLSELTVDELAAEEACAQWARARRRAFTTSWRLVTSEWPRWVPTRGVDARMVHSIYGSLYTQTFAGGLFYA